MRSNILFLAIFLNFLRWLWVVKPKYFINLKILGKLNFHQCIKYHDYWMFYWDVIAGDGFFFFFCILSHQLHKSNKQKTPLDNMNSHFWINGICTNEFSSVCQFIFYQDTQMFSFIYCEFTMILRIYLFLIFVM